VRRVHAVVSGRVQGVGMRWSCAREAERHGVVGWVRNRDDGTVEAVLEGESGAVGAVVAWLHRGPGTAEVLGVELDEEEPRGERGFTVR
jgi:acylphosphatase